MTYITFEWSHFFIRSKQFIRFYQNLGLFNYQVFSPSSHHVSMQSMGGFVVNSVNTFACSKKIIYKFSINPNNNNYFSSPLSSNMSTGCSVVEYPKNDVFDIPGILITDNLMYEQTLEFVNNESYGNTYYELNNIFYENGLVYAYCFYSLGVLLTISRSLSKIYHVFTTSH